MGYRKRSHIGSGLNLNTYITNNMLTLEQNMSLYYHSAAKTLYNRRGSNITPPTKQIMRAFGSEPRFDAGKLYLILLTCKLMCQHLSNTHSFRLLQPQIVS